MSELREDFNKVVLSAYDPPPGPAPPLFPHIGQPSYCNLFVQRDYSTNSER